MPSALIGLTSCVFVLTGRLLPIRVSLAIFFLLLVWSFLSMRVTRLSLLPRLFIVIYALPFTTLIGYFFDRDYVWWDTLARIQLIRTPRVSESLVMLGIIGLAGMTMGMRIADVFSHRGRRSPPVRPATLPIPVFLFLLGASLLLSKLSTPTSTILIDPYSAEGTESPAELLNFNSAQLVSYILLLILYIDIERHVLLGYSTRWRMALVVGSLVFIVVFFQILTGNRESVGLIVAMIALYLTGPPRERSVRRSHLRRLAFQRFKRVALPVSIVVVLFLGLGAIRGTLSTRGWDSGFGEYVREGYAQSTWTAVLLTNLSVASDFASGSLEYDHGRTYLGFVISLPPGVVTNALGWQRPIDTVEGNPGAVIQERGIGTGGLHISVLPFQSFGAVGLLAIMAIIGYWIVRLELRNSYWSLWRRMLYGLVTLSSVRWFWYGDMALVRALMIGFLVLVLYRLLARPVGQGRTKLQPRDPLAVTLAPSPMP